MMKKEAKEKREMSMFMVIFIVIAIVYILSFIIPAGEYEREGTRVLPETFHVMDKVYLSPLDVVFGIGDTAYQTFGSLFVAILCVGGMMGVVNSTGAIDAFLRSVITKLRDRALFIIPCFIFAMGFFGCLGAMISTAILFIPLGLSVAKQLRADRKFATALILMGSYVGFMSSPVNPLTTTLGQGIAGLELYSGSGLRTIVTIVNLSLVSIYLVWYAKKASRTNKWEKDFGDETDAAYQADMRELSRRDGVILVLFFGSFLFFAAGAPLFHLTTLKLASFMLVMGIISGLAYGYDLDTTINKFIEGSRSMVGVLVFMIIASTMSYILNQSLILDSIVYYASIPLNKLGTTVAPIGMFIVNAFINIFIGSGSGQTTVVMPIMAPLADVVGVTRQMAVLTLQFGDGFTNLLSPTNSSLLANLALAKISMKDWYEIAVPIHAVMFVVCCITIVAGVAIGY